MVIAIGLVLSAGATVSLILGSAAILPFVIRYSKKVQRLIVFSTCIKFPRNMDYEDPLSVGVGGRSFKINFMSQVDNIPVTIGAWHLVPKSLLFEVFLKRNSSATEEILYNDLQTTSRPVVLYCHGNSNHRGSPFRVKTYRILQELNFHVIAFDYRGYGDSSTITPTEKGLVEDLLMVYNWLINSLDQENRPKVILWGHSLGSSVLANLVAHLPQMCEAAGLPCLPKPDALVLESPFNNLVAEIEAHPLSKLYSWLPYYKNFVIQPFAECSDFTFSTDQYLTRVRDVPILMLHSKYDSIVPYQLALELHKYLIDSRNEQDAPLTFHTFDHCHKLDHNNLCDAQDIKMIVANFIKSLESPEHENKIEFSETNLKNDMNSKVQKKSPAKCSKFRFFDHVNTLVPVFNTISMSPAFPASVNTRY